jgi:hypothetical protein
MTAQGEKRALLVGISDYLPPAGSTFPVEPGHALDSRFAPGTTWNNLHAPESDVAAIGLLLHENFGFDYPNNSGNCFPQPPYQRVFPVLN